ncbi:MAG: LysR family transcriptional regulator [Nitriliruptoraceae bacterium]
MLDLHRLHLLHRFAQHGSIAATAAAVGYTPSAVSQQLATLERETGVALLDRTARSAELTALGRRLARHAADILAAVEAAEVDLAERSSRPSGTVHIAAVPSAAVALAPALATVRADHPDVELVVHQSRPGTALTRLRAREIDLAIVDDHAPDPPTTYPRLDAEVLRVDPLVLVLPAGHPVATGEGSADLAALTEGPWLCAPTGEPSRTATDRVLAEAGVTPTTLWEFEGLATLATLVSQGVGIAVLPRLAITRPLEELVAVRALPVPTSRAIVAVTRTSSRHRPAIEATLAALRAEA